MTRIETIAQALSRNKLTVSVAESCSGGLLSAQLTKLPGSSQFFLGGIVAYHNDAKIQLVKIPAETLQKHGAVSEETAEAMAKNVREIFGSDFGIGVTGIAGPDGGSKAKPAGLVFVAVATRLETLCLKCQFPGNREQIRQQAVDQALTILQEFLG